MFEVAGTRRQQLPNCQTRNGGNNGGNGDGLPRTTMDSSAAKSPETQPRRTPTNPSEQLQGHLKSVRSSDRIPILTTSVHAGTTGPRWPVFSFHGEIIESGLPLSSCPFPPTTGRIFSVVHLPPLAMAKACDRSPNSPGSRRGDGSSAKSRRDQPRAQTMIGRVVRRLELGCAPHE